LVADVSPDTYQVNATGSEVFAYTPFIVTLNPTGNCPDGYDTQTFTTPTIIDTSTTWTCVHYSVINVTVTDTGSLTINNSTIDQSPYATAGAGIRNYGPLTYNFSTILIDTDTPQSAFETHHSYMSSVEVRGYAHAEIYDSTSAGFGIAPTVHVTINNFNAELMTGTYDFTTQWGMTTPYLYVQNFTAPVTLNLVDGVTATISSSTFSIVGVINAGTNIVDSSINTLVMTEESTVTIDPSTIQYLILFDQASDTLTINNFNETNNDGGNFNFDTWGFSQLHVTTVSSTVLHVALFMMQGGHISVTHSTLSQVHTTNGALGTVQGSEIGILEASNAAAVNATGSTFQIVACVDSGTARVTNSTSLAIISDNGSLIQLLNVTDTIEQASNGGSIQKSWYAFVNVYDSVTHLPLSGVSLSVEDTFGNSQTESIDGSARFILREYDLLSDLSHEWSVDYYPYDLTASKLGYQTAAASIAHFSNPTINLYLIPSVPCTGGVCEVTFHTNPTMIGSITITGHGTYHNGEIATLPPDTYSITADIPTGYSFLAWTTSGVFVSPSTTATATMTVNSNGDVTANYHATTCKPCRVTFFSTPTPYGTVSVAGHGTYTNGQYVDLPPGIYTVTATPPYSVPPTPSWAFLSWSIAGGVGITGGSTATLTVTGTGDGAVTAIFQQLSTHATISVNTSPSGLDTPTGSGTYTISDIATVSVSNVPGYTFQKWQRDGTDYTTQQTFLYVVDANHTFTAVFQPIQSGQYTITVNTSPSGLDSPTGAGTHATGTAITISVGNASGYTFQKWLRDGADYSTQQSFQYTVDANHIFTAVFQSIVTPPSSGLTISLGSAHLVMQAGGTAQFTVAVASTESTQVTLTISNLPSGWQYAFTPTVGTTSPQFTSTLTVTTSSTATAGNYNITVTATGNGKTVSDHFIVEVASPTTTITNPSPRCIIATATYGSEMAPEVVFMRYVRDNEIGSTPTGRILRDAWNTFYYSWSPPVAEAISASPTLQATFRVLLLPLDGTIHVTAWVFTTLGSGDLASVIAFTVAAVLSISSYIALPLVLSLYAVKVAWTHRKNRRERKQSSVGVMGFGVFLSTLTSAVTGDANSIPLVTAITVLFLLVGSVAIGLLITYIATRGRQ
jgi:hypothetical protein